MTVNVERFAFTAILTAIVGTLLGLSLTLSPIARLAPLVIGVPTFLLLCRELVADWPPMNANLAGAQGADALEEGLLFGWLLSLCASTFLLGIAAGLSLFVFFFLLVRSSERWTLAAGFGLGLWLLLEGFVDRLLRITLYGGVLRDWID